MSQKEKRDKEREKKKKRKKDKELQLLDMTSGGDGLHIRAVGRAHTCLALGLLEGHLNVAAGGNEGVDDDEEEHGDRVEDVLPINPSGACISKLFKFPQAQRHFLLFFCVWRGVGLLLLGYTVLTPTRACWSIRFCPQRIRSHGRWTGPATEEEKHHCQRNCCSLSLPSLTSRLYNPPPLPKQGPARSLPLAYCYIGRTYHDKRARDIDRIQQHLPTGLQLPPFNPLDRDKLLAGDRLQTLLHVGLEPLGDDVEAHGNDAKQAKGQNLHRHTREGNVLAHVHLVEIMFVGNRCSGDHDGADELEEQGGDVEGDKDRGHEAG